MDASALACTCQLSQCESLRPWLMDRPKWRDEMVVPIGSGAEHQRRHAGNGSWPRQLYPQLRTCPDDPGPRTLSAKALNRCRASRCAGCPIEGWVASREETLVGRGAPS